MISKAQLQNLLITGRNECYVKKSSISNPYIPGEVYDWHFELEQDQYTFTDSYRGLNPYSGVEYIYIQGQPTPIWSCDYVGYALENPFVVEKEIYGFLKKARGNHLLNCSGNVMTDFSYKDTDFSYQTTFSGSLNFLLQIEEIHFYDSLIGRQISAGYLKE